MPSMNVQLGARSYPIHIGPGLLDQPLAEVNSKRVLIVSNTVVAPLYLDKLQAALQKVDVSSTACILPDGEAH